ncbi:MAG: hypothetical protein R3D58_18355 [Saprospiraceae bacterium]
MSNLFLTAPDPDYRIKGSRDPLGFQPVWQQTGKLIIPYLSTVSSFLQDFQTLALAWQIRQTHDLNEADFARFFQRWEQLMAYVRKSRGDEQVLGITRVQKHWLSDRLPVSSEPGEVILLESQRTAGVWGRYNSPFSDMCVREDQEFAAIFSKKINRVISLRRFQDCLKKDRFFITKAELADFAGLFDLAEQERLFWGRVLLVDKVHGDFRKQVAARWDDLLGSDFFAQLALLRRDADETLARLLLCIEHSERLICPLNRIFRYLQTRSFWTKVAIEGDEFIHTCREANRQVQEAYLDMPAELAIEKKELLGVFRLESNWEIVAALAHRNSAVSERRRGAPWIAIVNDGVEIYHREGANGDTRYDPERWHDNDYFTGTYFGLYEALQQKTTD